MTTENDIKRFFQENQIRVPKDDKFMKDLVRQINQLPTPASLDRNHENSAEYARIISLISKALKRRNKQMAIESLIVSVIFCLLFVSIAVAAGELVPESEIFRTLVEFRYLICGIICTVFVMIYNDKVYSETLQ